MSGPMYVRADLSGLGAALPAKTPTALAVRALPKLPTKAVAAPAAVRQLPVKSVPPPAAAPAGTRAVPPRRDKPYMRSAEWSPNRLPRACNLIPAYGEEFLTDGFRGYGSYIGETPAGSTMDDYWKAGRKYGWITGGLVGYGLGMAAGYLWRRKR